MCAAKSDVCFTPNSDRESGLPQTVMSALPPIADMCSALAHVCFGPKADIAALFDHLVGGDHKPWRNRDAERFRRSKVDDCSEFGRRLYREIGGLVAAQDTINIRRR